MRLLALDFGTKLGWAVRSSTGAIDNGTVVITAGRYQGPGGRWLHLHRWLNKTAEVYGPFDAVYFEQVRAHKGVAAAHLYGGYVAHVTAWAESRGIPYKGVPVQTIKIAATGKGNAKKAEVIEGMRAKGFRPQTDNDADALALLDHAMKGQAA